MQGEGEDNNLKWKMITITKEKLYQFKWKEDNDAIGGTINMSRLGRPTVWD